MTLVEDDHAKLIAQPFHVNTGAVVRRDRRRVRRIHAHGAHLMIHTIDHGQMIAAVEDLLAIGRQHEGQAVRPALVARIVKAEMRL